MSLLCCNLYSGAIFRNALGDTADKIEINELVVSSFRYGDNTVRVADRYNALLLKIIIIGEGFLSKINTKAKQKYSWLL